MDIVLCSYEVLRSEFNYVKYERRALREVQRYPVPPSPILAVNWWRMVIDEAQCVESAAGAAAQMCARLTAVNRWCVTGTPLTRSIHELHGLMCCLNARPFVVDRHLMGALIRPYVTGADEQLLIESIAPIMCRTMKRHVKGEVGSSHSLRIV